MCIIGFEGFYLLLEQPYRVLGVDFDGYQIVKPQSIGYLMTISLNSNGVDEHSR